MTPLFAATQGSFGSGMTQTQESMSVDGRPGLRATQNLQFTPTQDQGRSQTFDWLNPTQVCFVLNMKLIVKANKYVNAGFTDIVIDNRQTS